MKKFLGVFMSIALFASCCGMLIGCGEQQPDFSIKFNLSNYSIDIGDATNLGVAQIDDSMKLVKTTNLLLTDNEISHNIVEVKYKDTAGNIFFIDNSETEVYQFYTTDEFTFVSYISSNIRKYATLSTNYPNRLAVFDIGSTISYIDFFYDIAKNIPENFNTTNYYNSQFIHSYIIYNDTGKIYDTKPLLDGLSAWNFDIVNNLIKINETYYNLQINETNELIVKQIVQNTDITIHKVYKDKNDILYVYNDILNTFDHENNTLYTTSQICLGSDGLVYFDNNETPILTQLNGTQTSEVTNSDNMTFDGDYLIKIENGILFKDTAGQKGQVDGIPNFVVYDIGNNCKELRAFSTMQYDFDNNILFETNSTGLFAYKDYDFRTEYLGEPIFLIQSFELIPYTYLDNGVSTTITAIKEITPTNTSFYKLFNNGSTIVLQELINTEYPSTVIILQPIN